ncbi:MAG: hypothetical protein LBU42_07055 [Prevotellaceae bacterium]|jgi:hypothetical protein|nr:hypothetical protein [Prevotellaceae bacterium]
MKTLSNQTTQKSPFGGLRGFLLLLLWGVGGLFEGLFAQATVTPLSVDYDRQQVTFRVAWSGTAANNRVWVWVDFCPVAGTSPGTFAKAVIGGATATAGSILTVADNTRGFYVTANPSTVTATLSNAVGRFNWCAYGSDYPPNAKDKTGGGYDLKGTPPFIVTTASGTAEVNANTYSGGTITAITDATGCPGALCGKNGEAAGLLNCCVTGTTDCSGICKANETYTLNDGACTGQCNEAYVQLYNQCDDVINSQYSTYANEKCMNGCALNCANCMTACRNTPYPHASTLWGSQCYCTHIKCTGKPYTYKYHFAVSDGIWTLDTIDGYWQDSCASHVVCN